MKLSSTAILTIATASVAVEAAPAPQIASSGSALVKREQLEQALTEFEELTKLRAKREELGAELSAREYQIVTEILSAIKDTDLAPTILKYIVQNDTLSNIAVEAIVLVVKSGVVSVTNLLTLLVQSGLITDVLNSLLSDCEIYESFIDIAKNAISDLFKRDNELLSHEQGLELLRRDGMIAESEFDGVDIKNLEARDLDDVIVNLLQSLGSSGLATQVVKAVLTDKSFLSFGVELIKTLYDDGLLKLSSLVSAVEQSGLLPQLFKDLFNVDTLKEIVSTAVSAFSGKCSSSSSVSPSSTSNSTYSASTSSAVSTSSSSGSSSVLGLLSGSSIVSLLLGKVFGSSGSSDSSSTSTETATSVATETSVSTDPCSTDLRRKRMRLY